MPDVFTKAKRSEVMSRIRGRGNKDTELALMRVFRELRITGWRRHSLIKFKVQSSKFKVAGREGAGKFKGRGASARNRKLAIENRQFRVRPDFVFPKLRVAVFVDGCFWHGCPRHATQPKGNAAFWRKKLAGNRARDRLVTRTLRRAGWRVLRLWEHELTKKGAAKLKARVKAECRMKKSGKRESGNFELADHRVSVSIRGAWFLVEIWGARIARPSVTLSSVRVFRVFRG